MRIEINGRKKIIPDEIITKYMKAFDMTKEEAIEMYLEEEGELENEEFEELDAKASKEKIKHGAKSEEALEKKERKPRTVKISDEKQALFSFLVECLQNGYENIEVVKENKLLRLAVGDKMFKVDLIEERKKK